jgi:hypothetical protein
VQQRLGEAGAVAVALRKGVDRLAGDAGEEAGFDGALDGVVFGGAGQPRTLAQNFRKPMTVMSL